LRFPKDAQRKLGKALEVAQEGGCHSSARPMLGSLSEVMEIVANCAGGTYRLMYATEISEAIHVLHVFKKKAHHGIATPKKEIDLIEKRLKGAKKESGRG
jgi:phage-related protein